MVFCVTFSYEPLSLPRCVVGPVGLAFYNSFRSARASFSEVSFLPYLFHEVYHTHMAKLYVSGADGVLNVWIDPREVRRAESCHDKKSRQVPLANDWTPFSQVVLCFKVLF